jgi:hypothetical protein
MQRRFRGNLLKNLKIQQGIRTSQVFYHDRDEMDEQMQWIFRRWSLQSGPAQQFPPALYNTLAQISKPFATLLLSIERRG